MHIGTYLGFAPVISVSRCRPVCHRRAQRAGTRCRVCAYIHIYNVLLWCTKSETFSADRIHPRGALPVEIRSLEFRLGRLHARVVPWLCRNKHPSPAAVVFIHKFFPVCSDASSLGLSILGSAVFFFLIISFVRITRDVFYVSPRAKTACKLQCAKRADY